MLSLFLKVGVMLWQKMPAWVWDYVADFFRAPHKALTPSRRRTHRGIWLLAAVVAALGLWGLSCVARIQVAATEDPLLWTAAMLSQVALTKLPLLILSLGLMVLLFPVAWRWLFSTVASRQSLHYHRNDAPTVKAYKALGAAVLQSALLVVLGSFLVAALFAVR